MLEQGVAGQLMETGRGKVNALVNGVNHKKRGQPQGA